jgi:hypothetical protein
MSICQIDVDSEEREGAKVREGLSYPEYSYKQNSSASHHVSVFN